MEHSRHGPAVSRSTIAFLFVSLLIVMSVRMLEFAPPPYGPAAADVLRVLGPISAVLAVILLAVVLAAVATLRARSRDVAPDEGEEPWLSAPRLPRSRARCPLVGFVDLEPGAGASTIVFNLGNLLATEGTSLMEEGQRHRPRPLCLLAEGPLTEALGLSPEPLREHLAEYPGRVTQDVIDLAVRHPSGCELLCVPRGQMGRHHLRLLRDAAERYYDALIVDCSSGDSWLREGIEDVSDSIVLVALPSAVSAEAAARAAERALAGHRLAVTALLVNQVNATQNLPQRMTAIFESLAHMPEHSAIAEMDRQAIPWCLDPLAPASRQLRQIASVLLPEVLAEQRNAG